MSDVERRLTENLEPILALSDPRKNIGSYHGMPHAIFRYDPEEEFGLRKQLTLLETRLSQRGKDIARISLSKCLDAAMRQHRPMEDWFSAERKLGTQALIETVHAVLSEGEASLVNLVVGQLPTNMDPLRDIVFITRAGALFPLYRIYSLLEQLRDRLHVPTILFYPGVAEGTASLRFMGVLDAEHNYRLRIF